MASIRNALAICDTCGFQYPHRVMRLNSYGLLVCPTDFEGGFDLKNDPQNKAPDVREDINISNPRPPSNRDRNITWGQSNFDWDDVFKFRLPTTETIVTETFPVSTNGSQLLNISVTQDLLTPTKITMKQEHPSTSTVSATIYQRFDDQGNRLDLNNMPIKISGITGTVEVGMAVSIITGTSAEGQLPLRVSWQPSTLRKHFSFWSNI
jgi:hypothetical protein|tara:strand:+ start:148 stop:771 length:624 start_codon:yes stop_codon:yes gene_type:complete